MLQISFTKFTKRLVIVSMVLCVLFFAGCGNKEKGEEDNSNLPQVPSVGANDGKLENNGGENKAVTKENLPQFVEELEAAMWGDGSGAAKTRDADEREIDTVFDGRGGSRIIDILFIGGSEDNATATLKLFNFSKSGKLFLGGGIGAAVYFDEITNEQEMKFSGEVKFNGIFTGSVVYKNYYQKSKHSGSAKEGTLTSKLVSESGDVVVKSGGSEIPFKEYSNILLQF